MTVIEAYRVLGLDRYTHALEIERTYKSRIQDVHLRLVTGQPQPVREKAQHDLMALSQAKEVLMQHHGRAGSPSAKASRKSSANPKSTAAPRPLFVVAAAFMIAASITAGMAVVCFRSVHTATGAKTDSKFIGGTYGMVHVEASQPCDIRVDGNIVGQNSAMVDLNIREGSHNMVFKYRGFELGTMITVIRGQTISIDVDFAKKQVQIREQGSDFRRSLWE